MNFLTRFNQVSLSKVFGRFLTIFGGICVAIACFSVFLNDIYYFFHYNLSPSAILFCMAFLLAALPSAWGLAVVLALLPLTSGISGLVRAIWGLDLLAMPNPGLDLVAGLYLGYFIWGFAKGKESKGIKERFLLASSSGFNLAWPIGLVLLVISLSSALAITRNLYLSATTTSFKGLLYNFIHFRPMDWRADYLSLGNWITYAIAAGLIAVLVSKFKDIPSDERAAWVFRPLMVGLVISAVIGLIQAATGLGLSEAQLGFRKDAFGYAAMGMQPDLHAFAAHMLLGVVGFWGYYCVCKSRFEKYAIVGIFFLCFAALLVSKSRASLMIAMIALGILGLAYFYRTYKKYFFTAVASFLILVLLIVVGIKTENIEAITSLGWVGELLIQMQQRRLDSWSDLSGLMGSRFEIWSAVSNMFAAYPLMGVGEGEFYRLSSNISFARSEFLQLNHGENAHNYFLQVLAENGIVGIIVFVIAFVVPYRACNNKYLVLPAVIGLSSLFLGNIFAHAFLVRENLLLGAVLLGLIYLFSGDEEGTKGITKKASPLFAGRANYFNGIALLILLGGIICESYFSFGRMPFKAGADCFVKELPLYQDGWTSGAWEERLPKGATAVDLQLIPNRSDLGKNPLSADFSILSWEAGKGKVTVATTQHKWISNDAVTLHLELPPQYYESKDVITTRLQLSNCYTPRDLGVNTDGRRLGVFVNDLSYK